MSGSLKLKRRRRGRSVDLAVVRYEALKSAFKRKSMSPAEYARACRRAAWKAGL